MRAPHAADSDEPDAHRVEWLRGEGSGGRGAEVGPFLIGRIAGCEARHGCRGAQTKACYAQLEKVASRKRARIGGRTVAHGRGGLSDRDIANVGKREPALKGLLARATGARPVGPVTRL